MALQADKFSEADKLFSSAMALVKSADYHAAASLLIEITRKFESYGKAWFELGNLMQRQLEDFAGAAECYRKAIEVTPAYAPAYLAFAGILFETGEYAEMNALLNQAMEIPGVKKDQVMLKTAMLMESQGRYNEAIDQYKKAILASFSEENIADCEKGITRCEIKKKYAG